MAHFAEIDETNTVIRVIVVYNNDILDSEGNESGTVGAQYCADLFGGTWVQTSYWTAGNLHYGSVDGGPIEPDGGTPLHMNYAGVGFTWDGTGFAEPQPYDSWVLDDNYVWQPPTPKPDDGLLYDWDEATATWVEAT